MNSKSTSYRDAAAALAQIPKYAEFGNVWWDTRLRWREQEMFDLTILAEGDAEIEAAANCLGRSPSSIAWRARENKITLPTEWARIIAPKRKTIKPANPSLLAYPYVTKAKPENLDLLTINNLVPKTIPEHARADICQEIMLAVLEGRTSLEALQANGRSPSYFMRKFYKDNYEDAGRAVSFNFTDDDRSYDEIAASGSAHNWRYEEMNDNRKAYDALNRNYTMPNQLEAVFNDQIGRLQLGLSEMGRYMSRREVEDWVNEHYGT